MSNVLEQYYQGITQQLRAEVDFINALFQHQGVKGEGNETILRDLVRKFIPKKYGVGTGVVIDRLGTPSRQCDIIIYEPNLYPSLLSLTTVHLFPVDVVYATIEVKTTLTSQTAKDALENIASVRGLLPVEGEYSMAIPGGGGLQFWSFKPSPPYGAIFAYDSEARKFDTFKNWFVPQEGDDVSLFPVLVGCLDAGLVGFQNLSPTSGDHPTGRVVPLVIPDRSGGLSPVFLSEIRPDGQVPLTDPGKAAGITYWERDGIRYPVKQVDDVYLLIDQSRALLLFLLQLNDLLSHKHLNPELRFTEHYLTSSGLATIER